MIADHFGFAIVVGFDSTDLGNNSVVGWSTDFVADCSTVVAVDYPMAVVGSIGFVQNHCLPDSSALEPTFVGKRCIPQQRAKLTQLYSFLKSKLNECSMARHLCNSIMKINV